MLVGASVGVGVLVAVAVSVGVAVGGGVFVGVLVRVGVLVAVAVGVGVEVAVPVAVGVAVGVAVAVAVGVAVDVLVGVGVEVAVAVFVGVGVMVGVSVMVSVAVGVGSGAGRSETAPMAQSTEAPKFQSRTTAPAGVCGPSVEPLPRTFAADPCPSVYPLQRSVCPPPADPVGNPLPVERKATASTTQALLVAVVTVTLGFALVPIAKALASMGLVWSTPVSDMAPQAAFAAADSVTTTLLAPVAGATNRHSSTRTLVPLFWLPTSASAVPA